MNVQLLSDRVAIGFSMLCALHCLALPVLLVAVPSIAALGVHNESFHVWMLAMVIPPSVLALTLGCQQHKRVELLVVGALGIAILFAALLLPETWLGEWGEWVEKTLTVFGAAIVACAHIVNYSLCREGSRCSCSSHD